MHRRLFMALSVLSLVLCAMALAGWIGSWMHPYVFSWGDHVLGWEKGNFTYARGEMISTTQALAYELGLQLPFWLIFGSFFLGAFVFAIAARYTRSIPAGNCTACGYNLTGNTSGVCPECGTAISTSV
jgi:hypothetical protein